jgi:hypothetical protein
MACLLAAYVSSAPCCSGESGLRGFSQLVFTWPVASALLLMLNRSGNQFNGSFASVYKDPTKWTSQGICSYHNPQVVPTSYHSTAAVDERLIVFVAHSLLSNDLPL